MLDMVSVCFVGPQNRVEMSFCRCKIIFRRENMSNKTIKLKTMKKLKKIFATLHPPEGRPYGVPYLGLGAEFQKKPR